MKYKLITIILIALLTFNILPVSKCIAFEDENNSNKIDYSSEEVKQGFKELLEALFFQRNAAIVSADTDLLKGFYDTEIKVSLWAYENEAKKTMYLINWSEKQAVKFKEIKSIVKIRKVAEKEKDLYGVICDIATDFYYYYIDSPEVINHFRLGTNHYLNLKKMDEKYIITKEWYTDPFADSLDLKNLKSEEIKEFILTQSAPNYNPSESVQKAVDYAHMYSGIYDDEELIFKYNKDYRDHNPDGGDCANFASQILYESGAFKKNSLWNHNGKNGTKAWLNAQGFKNYMISSGRASYISKGKYQEIYKDAFNMRPGDFVAYEKKNRITHVSTVTGFDSKGYPLVTCHNTNRLLVPYDLGWSNDNIRFHLIHVHY